MNRFVRPLFDWQPPPAVVHVHAESGAGDNFALLRFLPLLAERGYTVRYEARDDFFNLVRGSLPAEIEVVPQALDYPGSVGLKNFDYHLPVGELPHVFGTDIDTVPWSGPYLKADPELVKQYAKYRGRIGIAWSSGILDHQVWLKRYGQLKSLHWWDIEPILDRKIMVNLQVGPPRRDNNLCLDDPLPAEPTWADTAALVENLSLVITPDTGLAHLAGAMGKPCWVMMHGHNQGWHFMCARPGASWNERSPWYPSIRLFRQPANSTDWSGVVAEIAEQLEYSRYGEAAE
jgi:hypothetical protein